MGNSKTSAFKSALAFDARQLAKCMEIIAEQKVLLTVVKSALPAEIAAHVQHCVLSGTRLLVYTESTAWASQIRFFHAAILNKLAESGQKKILALQVRLDPQIRQPSTKRGARLPSAENINQLRNQVKGRENDDVLTQAIAKLAGTLEKRLKPKA